MAEGRDRRHRGVRVTDDTVEVRHRGQALIGANAWVAVPLVIVAALAAYGAATRQLCRSAAAVGGDVAVASAGTVGCDETVRRLRPLDDLDTTSLGVLVVAIVALAVVVVVGTPFLVLGRDEIRFRNRFRRRSIPVTHVERLVVSNRNPRSWVPALTAIRSVSAGDDEGRPIAFLATLAYRPASAAAVREAVIGWADANGIDHDVPVDSLRFRFQAPGRRPAR